MLEKTEYEAEYENDYSLHEKYPNHWAVLAGKGYQGADEFLRCITPHKKPIRGMLSRESMEFNEKHLSDRIIVEN